MAVRPSSMLQGMLQAAVESVKWHYSLFWKMCPRQGILIWGGGYYNGPIRTRKTVQPMEVTAEEASLQRSLQLRDLYESLSTREINQPQRRPCAALSPEDLTETEWFYLLCVSFSFPPGVGLPGKALARQQHMWMTGANKADSETFSRAILAKSARIQTVVCIPLLDGVVEFGSAEKVSENLSFINHVKSFFIDQHLPRHPKPALSENSTSNPASSSEYPRFQYATIAAVYAAPDAPGDTSNQVENDEVDEDNDEDDDADEDEDMLDSEAKTGRDNIWQESNPNLLRSGARIAMEMTEPSQFRVSEDIRMGSPGDGSTNLDSDFPMLSINQRMENVTAAGDHQWQAESFRGESTRRWQQAPSGPPLLDKLSQGDTHYLQTVSMILQCQQGRWAESPSTSYVGYSSQSAFSKWSARAVTFHHFPAEGTSQWLLKHILFSVPVLHSQRRDENSPKSSRDGGDGGTARFRKGALEDGLSANHVLAERWRCEKLNERFLILRSLVPFVTKMDKASILGDTIKYVEQLRKKIQDLEAKGRLSTGGDLQRSSSVKQLRSAAGGVSVSERVRPSPRGSDKRKLSIVEGGSRQGAKPKVVEPQTPTETSVQVSIIENDALLELQCPHKEGLLLEAMKMLQELRIETTAIQCSLMDGFLVVELRAKVKENGNGKKASIGEVKRTIWRIVPHPD